MPAPNHTYTIALRIAGDPDEIASILKLESDHWSHGEAIGKRLREPFWGYEGSADPEFRTEWSSFEEGLAFLTAKLNRHKDRIRDLAGRLPGTWWCGHFQQSFDGGPTLSPQIMVEVASFGCPLFIDNYITSEESDSNEESSSP